MCIELEKLKERFKESPEIMNLIVFVLVGALLVYITNNFFSVIAPFVVAYIITVVLRPAIVWVRNKTKIPNAIATTICLIGFVIVLGSILWIAGYYVVDGATYIINLLSSDTTIEAITQFAKDFNEKLKTLSDFLNIEIKLKDIATVITDAAKSIISALSTISLNIAAGIPNFIISFVIGCIAAFYMLFDYEKISTVLKKQMSDKTKKLVSIFNNQVLFSLFKMMFSYALLSIICFVELMVGFHILGVEDATFLALIIAIFDILPVVGSGGILVPGGIIALIMGDPFVGIGMIILWTVIVVVRQVLEPKIVGSQIGLYPLVTVATLYIGLKLMGALGLIVAPLYVIICKKLNEEGLIHWYKSNDLLNTKNDNCTNVQIQTKKENKNKQNKNNTKKNKKKK